MAQQNFSMIRTEDGLTIVIGTDIYECRNDHPNYDTITQAIKDGDIDRLPNLINLEKAVTEYLSPATTNEDVKIEDGIVYYKGKAVHGTLVDHILKMMREGFDVQPMINFLANLHQNPSSTAVNELYEFLLSAKLPITDDGHFLAYKRVKYDYTSVHDGVTDNSIGVTLFMERNMVDDNRNNTCSYGYHFCSFSYLSSFYGDRTVILKINPKDVVSIPSDYNNAKGRANTYVVVGEVDQQQVSKGRDVLSECDPVVSSASEVPTADQYQAAEWNNQPADIQQAPAVNETVAEHVIIGYDDGYRDGRYGKYVDYKYTSWETQYNEYREARLAGFADGRSHNVRKYKAPSKQ